MPVWVPNGTSTVTVDNGAGVAKNITAYVKSITGLDKVFDMLDKTTLADSAERTAVGVQLALTLEISGDFNDAVDGPHDVFSSIAESQEDDQEFTSTVTVVLDGTNRISCEAVLEKYSTPVNSKQLIGFTATMKSDGTVTIDTV